MSVAIFPQIPVEIDDATMQDEAHAQMDMSPGRSPPQLDGAFNSFPNPISNVIQPQWPSSQPQLPQQAQDPMMITTEMADAQIIPEIEPYQMYYEAGTTEVDMNNGETLEQEYEMMGDAEEYHEEAMVADQSLEVEQPSMATFTAPAYTMAEHSVALEFPSQADMSITSAPLLSQTMMTQSQSQPVETVSGNTFGGHISPVNIEAPSIPEIPQIQPEASLHDSNPPYISTSQPENSGQDEHVSPVVVLEVKESVVENAESATDHVESGGPQEPHVEDTTTGDELVQPAVAHQEEPSTTADATETPEDAEYNENPIPPILVSIQFPTSPAPAKLYSLFTAPDPAALTSSSLMTLQEAVPTLLLGGQHHLFFANVSELLGGLREDLIEKGFKKETFEFMELILSARALDLTLSEDNIYAREVSLYDFVVLHQSCSVPGYLHLDVTLQVRFRSRYEEIKKAITAAENQAFENEQDLGNAHDEHGSPDKVTQTQPAEEVTHDENNAEEEVEALEDHQAYTNEKELKNDDEGEASGNNVPGSNEADDEAANQQFDQHYEEGAPSTAHENQGQEETQNEGQEPEAVEAAANENPEVEDPLLEWKDEDYPPLPPEEDGDYLDDGEVDLQHDEATGAEANETENETNAQPDFENGTQEDSNETHDGDEYAGYEYAVEQEKPEVANEDAHGEEDYEQYEDAPHDADPAQVEDEPSAVEDQESQPHQNEDTTTETEATFVPEPQTEDLVEHLEELGQAQSHEPNEFDELDENNFLDEAAVPLPGGDDDVSTLQESEVQEQDLENVDQGEHAWDPAAGDEAFEDAENDVASVTAIHGAEPLETQLKEKETRENVSPARSMSGAKRRYDEYAEEDVQEEEQSVTESKRARHI